MKKVILLVCMLCLALPMFANQNEELEKLISVANTVQNAQNSSEEINITEYMTYLVEQERTVDEKTSLRRATHLFMASRVLLEYMDYSYDYESDLLQYSRLKYLVNNYTLLLVFRMDSHKRTLAERVAFASLFVYIPAKEFGEYLRKEWVPEMGPITDFEVYPTMDFELLKHNQQEIEQAMQEVEQAGNELIEVAFPNFPEKRDVDLANILNFLKNQSTERK